MRSSSFLLFLPLCVVSVIDADRVRRETAEEIASTFLQPQFGAPAAHSLQAASHPSPGPIIETGRFNVVSSKLLKGSNMPEIRRAPVSSQLIPETSYSETAPRREQLQHNHNDQQQQRLYRYDGPLDGRRVWIYKKILRPVRITSHGMERLPGAQVVDQWAEGGFGNEFTNNVRAPIYAPTNNGFFTETVGQFAHV